MVTFEIFIFLLLNYLSNHCLHGISFSIFAFSTFFYLYAQGVSQHVVGFHLFIFSDNICSLMAVFNSFTFNLITYILVFLLLFLFASPLPSFGTIISPSIISLLVNFFYFFSGYTLNIML